MALSDTARLIASLELQDKFSKPAASAERSLTGLDRKMNTLGQNATRLGGGLSRAVGTIAKIGAGLAVGGVAVLATQVKAGVDSLNELQNVTVATNTVIKSTQGIAGQTAKGIRAMSEGFEDLNATMDDKVIQSGANLLLTFTGIRKKAFEPALEAALNMNEAMGGGEEGLQRTIIQVGKALNDPIKGATALRRVGVQLTSQQEDQIRTLVEQNDLYGAQQVILDELTTQFGGRFAAAGKTAEGRMAALRDRVEDLQKKLAGPLLPAIDRVRERLIDFLGSRRVLRGAEDLGEAIAGLFTNKNIDKGVAFLEDAIDTITNFSKGKGGKGGGLATISANIGTIAGEVGKLPWSAIGDAARLLGTGSKALLDAFLGLPPWIQTAVLTGWGLNKLTGGALGSIVGELGKGLIKGVLNMNAAVVNVNAGRVTGAGGGLPTGGGVGGGRGRTGSVIGGAAKLIPIIGAVELGANLAGGKGPIESFFTQPKTSRGPVPVRDKPAIDAAEANALEIKVLQDRIREIPPSLGNRYLAPLRAQIHTLNASEGARAAQALNRQRMTTDAVHRLNSNEGSRAAAAHARLTEIRNKRTSVTANVNVNTTVVLSAAQANQQLQSLRQTVEGGGFI